MKYIGQNNSSKKEFCKNIGRIYHNLVLKTSSQIIPIRQIYASHKLKNIPEENLKFLTVLKIN
jgi:hypothetical protein